MPKKKLKIAGAQLLTNSDIAHNAKKIEKKIHAAADDGAHVVAFHEGALLGYPGGKAVARIDFAKTRRAEAKLQKLAQRLNIAVLVGSASKTESGVQNDVLIIDRDGRQVGRYAKTWRAGEPEYVAGSGPVVFSVAGVKATTIICHDLRYPELVRLAVGAGARLLFICNNESGLIHTNKLLGYRSMQIARATENYIYALMVNAPTDPDDVRRSSASHGNTMIVDPLGNVLDEADSFEERLVTATLDMTKATGGPPLRVLGKVKENAKLYGCTQEHPALAKWMSDGVKLVKRW